MLLQKHIDIQVSGLSVMPQSCIPSRCLCLFAFGMKKVNEINFFVLALVQCVISILYFPQVYLTTAPGHSVTRVGQ